MDVIWIFFSFLDSVILESVIFVDPSINLVNNVNVRVRRKSESETSDAESVTHNEEWSNLRTYSRSCPENKKDTHTRNHTHTKNPKIFKIERILIIKNYGI